MEQKLKLYKIGDKHLMDKNQDSIARLVAKSTRVHHQKRGIGERRIGKINTWAEEEPVSEHDRSV